MCSENEEFVLHICRFQEGFWLSSEGLFCMAGFKETKCKRALTFFFFNWYIETIAEELQ